MHRNVRRVAVVAAIALVAGMGGLALGDFAMSGSETGMNASAGVSDTVNEAIAGETAEAMRREPSAPSNYSCQGCDASAGGEPPMADDFQPFDSTPLPPYRPEPADLRPHDLPVIEADRTAPDAIRRRANGGEGPAAKSAPDVPVLAADRRETGSLDPD